MEFPMALATRSLLVLGLYTGIAKSDILFEDHFESGASPEWVSVKPSQYVEDGWFHSHDAVPDFYRDSAAFVHDGDPGWKDYTLSLKVDPLLNQDPFTGGFYKAADLFFRASDIEAAQFGVFGNYYRLHISTIYTGPVNYLHLVRCRNAAGFFCESLSEQFDVAGIFGPDPMDVLITLTGAHIQVKVDGSELVNLIDPAPLSHGGIGVGAVWEAHTRFDDVVVNAVPEPSTLGLIAEPDPLRPQDMHQRVVN